MKQCILLFLLLITGFVFSQSKQSTDSLGLPGDNLNLYAVLDAFRESETLDAFEKKLNDKEAKINNLDLNNDDKIDYIKINDHKDGDTHLIVMQIDVNEKEKQDVAVITVDKDKEGKVKLQIVGDPELYGKNYIIEPKDDAAGKKLDNNPPTNTTKKTDTTVTSDGKTVIINNVTNNYYTASNADNTIDDYKPVPPVHQWVIVHYMYSPGYTIYVSPWYWGYYPSYWTPWTPFFWHSYFWHHHHHWHHHHYYYHHSPYFYSKSYSGYYAPRRSVSTNYVERKSAGTFKKTYSRPDLGKPSGVIGRPNPGYQGPVKNITPKQPIKSNQPVRTVPGKQPLQKPGGTTKPPVQKMGPKPGGAPIQRSGGGGATKRGR